MRPEDEKEGNCSMQHAQHEQSLDGVGEVWRAGCQALLRQMGTKPAVSESASGTCQHRGTSPRHGFQPAKLLFAHTSLPQCAQSVDAHRRWCTLNGDAPLLKGLSAIWAGALHSAAERDDQMCM